MTQIQDGKFFSRARGLTAILDHAVSSHARAVAILVLAALIAFAPGLPQIPPVDREEARVAQSTKQVLETGDYIDIRFQNEGRLRKPAGIYWLQAGVVGAAEALGVPEARAKIWLYRIPSLAGAIGAVLLTYWAALAFVSRRAAVMASLMMTASILLGAEARLAKTDAMLLLTVIAAMGALARIYVEDRRPEPPQHDTWSQPAIFWTALAAGILLKGPTIVMIVAMTMIALVVCDRSARWVLALRPLFGVAWLAVLVLPWIFAAGSHLGQGVLTDSVGRDLLAKVIGARDAHPGPPGYHFALFWILFWPAATLAAMTAPSVWAVRREKGAQFLLAWIVPAWIVFELVPAKLPHYVLPLYPAIAILIAGVVDQHMLAHQRWLERGVGWWFFLPVALGICAIAALIVYDRKLGFLAWPFVAAAIILGLWAWRLYQADGAEHSLLRAILASILLSIGLFGIVMPLMESAFPSAAVSRILKGADCKSPLLAAAGFDEPSLVFMAGTETILSNGADAADFLRGGTCRFAAIEVKHERAFLRRAQQTGLRYAPPKRFNGFNYASGRAVSISVYQSDE